MPTRIDARIGHPPVRCARCADEIEACLGLHGDWMHSASRAEACRCGGWAQPQTVTDINREARAS